MPQTPPSRRPLHHRRQYSEPEQPDGIGWRFYVDASGYLIEMWENQVISNIDNTSPASIYYSYGGGVFVKHSTVSLWENEILYNVGSSAGVGGIGGGIYMV